MAYNSKSLANLKPFTGVDDERRCNGRPKGALNKATLIKGVLYGAHTREQFSASELVALAISEAFKGSTPAATALVEIMIGNFGTTKKAFDPDAERIIVDKTGSKKQ